MPPPNTACSGFLGVCAVYKHFSGFGLFLLSGIFPARPQTTTDNLQCQEMSNKKSEKEVSNIKRFRKFIFPSRFFVPCFQIPSLKTAFHAPALFFVFRVGLLLSNGKPH